MYSSEQLRLEELIYTDQLNELYKGLEATDVSHSIFSDGIPKKEDLEDMILRPNIIFTNVYYENVLTGYILLELRSTRTADFHWGVINKTKYLPKIIKDAFSQCCEMEIDNFIGWTPSDNALALKVAKRMGFEFLSQIPNYRSHHGAMTLSIYKNKR